MSDMIAAARAALAKMAKKDEGEVTDPDEMAEAYHLKPDGDGFVRAADGTQVVKNPQAIMAYGKYRSEQQPGIEVVDLNQKDDRAQLSPPVVDEGEPGVHVWQREPVIHSRTADQDKQYDQWLKKNAEMVKYHESKRSK